MKRDWILMVYDSYKLTTFPISVFKIVKDFLYFVYNKKRHLESILYEELSQSNTKELQELCEKSIKVNWWKFPICVKMQNDLKKLFKKNWLFLHQWFI